VGESGTPPWRGDVLQLAGEALQAQIAGDDYGAGATVQAISDRYGGGAVIYTMVVWCDQVAHRHPALAGLRPDDMVQLAWVLPGRPGEAVPADDVPPDGRWAGQLIMARCRMDQPAFTALLNSVPRESRSDYVLTLLASVAGTLRKIWDGSLPLAPGKVPGDPDA
jgi:hypothetical protein